MFQLPRYRFPRAVQLDINTFQNCFDVAVDFRIPKSDDAISFVLEPKLSNAITLGCFVVVMMSTVEFNDEVRGGTEKIHNIRSNGRLAPKVRTEHGKFF